MNLLVRNFSVSKPTRQIYVYGDIEKEGVGAAIREELIIRIPCGYTTR